MDASWLKIDHVESCVSGDSDVTQLQHTITNISISRLTFTRTDVLAQQFAEVLTGKVEVDLEPPLRISRRDLFAEQ